MGFIDMFFLLFVVAGLMVLYLVYLLNQIIEIQLRIRKVRAELLQRVREEEEAAARREMEEEAWLIAREELEKSYYDVQASFDELAFRILNKE